MTAILALIPSHIANFLADPGHAAVSLVAAFILGAVLGSFINVCIYRLPLEKSIIWPMASYCGHCWQPVRWYDNIPLVSYWLLLGRCRICKAPFSFRYFFVELLTALCFCGLFYLEVIRNIHQLDTQVLGPERAAQGRLTIFGFHAFLICLLLVVIFCDLDHLYIPLGLSIFGTVVGLIGSMLWPWPWPYTTQQALPGIQITSQEWGWTSGYIRLREALYPWPIWGPLPAILRPALLGNERMWIEGLATGLAGVLMGMFLLRGVRFLFGIGMGPSYMEDADPEMASRWFGRRLLAWFGRVGGKALGIGDADLMMMAGSFLGWQPTLVAFFLGVFIGLPIGVLYVLFRGNHPFAFAPPLALGVLITMLGWPWIGPEVQPFFFNRWILPSMLCLCLVVMPLAGLGIRLTKGRHPGE
jgi:leader peptidase (prepilin peptidase)/N-methyltransferase